MRYLFLLLVPVFLFSFQTDQIVTVEKEQAQRAFKFLNDIRTNPQRFRGEFVATIGPVAGIKTTALNWNETLAKAAEAKALDMAKRNYFAHVDPDGYGMNYHINKAGYALIQQWTWARDKNNFESIATQYVTGSDTAKMLTGSGVIKQLVIDEGVPSLGHRKHLLGLDEWNASLVDIGIGIARVRSGDKIVTYASVLIAKHNW